MTSLDKFVFNYPPDKPDIDAINIRMMNNIWSPLEKLNEIKNDRIPFSKLSDPLKRTFVHIMAYFSIGDQIVNDNIGRNLSRLTQDCPHSQIFYSLQQGQEAVHTWAYNVYNYHVLGLGSLDQHSESKNDVDSINIDNFTGKGVFEYLFKLKAIQRKVEWTRKYTEDDISLPRNIIAMVITEGIFFSSSFAFIFWLKSKNLFHGLTHYNDYISRDEGLHCEFGWTYNNNYVKNKLTKLEIIEMFTEAVDIEIDFFEDITRNVTGEIRTEMSEYIKYMADYLLGKLGIEPLYKAVNPYPFMKNLSIRTKSNMFERTNTEYAPISISKSDFDFM